MSSWQISFMMDPTTTMYVSCDSYISSILSILTSINQLVYYSNNNYLYHFILSIILYVLALAFGF